ncbi:MAG TPA: glycerol-3-phosphate dehydrogenase [Xanthobacteraceae bacterium]|nr:glycerol-3-phosphate dehydrogenase [Xanthobacteraceae bacterium]
MKLYDLAVIGGGINGVGVARDAAGRGLSVLLVEQGDLASATSSASTKLIHGGLRYLEHFRFRLVRESLRERALLLSLAPHLVRPMRFVMPHIGLRAPWKLRFGFKLYDWFGRTPGLAGSRMLDLADDPAGAPLKEGLGLGFEYFDCVADDARLVIANAIGAREKGADIRTRTRCVSARREDGSWQLVLQTGGGIREIVTSRALVNATGPWVARTQETILRQKVGTGVRLVKGSHIVLPRLHAHDRAYLLPNDDGRLVFAIPYGGDFTLVGTTEVEVSEHSTEATASSEEILYLCKIVSRFFRTQVKPSAVKWTFAGIRTLVDDGRERPSEVTRDYWIEAGGRYGEPPLLSIYGGKLTTYRALAEKVVDRLKSWMSTGPAWTHDEPLPGGDLGAGGVDELAASIEAVHPYLAAALTRRLARTYGTRVWTVLGDAQSADDLGPRIVADLHARELDYLRREEWALTADDVLWRRTKLGLRAKEGEVDALKKALGAAATQPAA